MPKKIEIAIVSAYDAKGSNAAAKALADLMKAGGKGSLPAAAAKDAAALAKIATAAAQAATSNQKLATEVQKTAAASNQAATALQRVSTEAQKTATATNQAATAAQRLATEQNKTAASAANVVAAQARAEQSMLRLSQAQNKAAAGGNYFKQVGDGVTSSIMGVVGPVAAASAAFGAATATVQSFADAFKFKADLDATTLAVNAQLQGMRDSGQVWNEASAFAQKFKLTQQETTQAISASIGVMRSSKAPVEDILGVLARMQVLSPEQSLQEAAIALKALASGDTTSLVTRFEVSRDVANQMKAEIQGGADAVQVMSKFLGDTGIGMDVLAAKTTGAAGALKDLAVAQEQLKLAQAEFAQGPGMVILEGQIRTVTGATRLLSGDFAAMGQSLANATVEFGASSAGAQAYFNALMSGASAAEAQAAANAAATATTQMLTQAHTDGGGGSFEFANATNTLTGAMSAESAAAAQLVAITQAETAVLADAASKSLIDAAAKQEEASKTELLTAQTTAAVSAFMLLHPNIDASGVAALVAAGKINPLLAQLIQATLRAREAAQALAQFNILSGVKAAGGNFGAASVDDANADKRAFRAQQQNERNRVALAQTTAERERTLAIGTTNAKIALYQKDYNAAVKLHGAGSTQAYEAQTKLLQAQTSGGAARAGAAGAAATKLEGIETKTGDKLSQIVQDTQAKLVAIDQKAADERARIAAELNNKLATSAADRRASAEADDLDLIGVTDEKEAAKLNDREKAQASAREREVAAAKEARDAIENGEAESASKVYDIRQKQIGDQQQLDEKYAEKQRELSGNEDALAALKTQYDEGTRANEEAASLRIAIAKAESDQKKAEVQAEKDAVIAAANEQANQVVTAAERSAAGVTKATGAAKAQATSDIRAIGDSVNALPANKVITITVKQDGTVGASSAGGGGSSNKAAGGGNFVTSGPTTLRVGDNPGGRELVTVTPLSGRGQSHASGNLIALAGGGTVDAGGGYTTPIAGGDAPKAGKGGKKSGGPATIDPKKALDEMKNTISLLMDMAKLKEQIAALAGVPAFDIPVVQALIKRAQEFTAAVNAHLVPLTKAEGEGLARYLSAAKDAVSLISDMVDLKKGIAELKDVPAFDQPTVLALIDRAQQFTTAMQSHLIPLTEFERDQFGRYASVVGDTVGILSDMADLKKDLAEPSPPINTDYIWQLVADAAVVTVILRERLLPTTEEQADAMGLYASAVGDTVSILSDVLSLGADLKDAEPVVITDAMITALANQAQRIATLVTTTLIPTSEEQADGMGRYASTVGDTVGIISDVLGLGKDLKDAVASPITDAMIIRLADQAGRVSTLVQARLIPTSEEQAKALSDYSDLVGSSASVLSDVANLSGELFTDYVSPTDAQINLLATDAQRVTAGVMAAAANYSKEGVEAGKAYAESVGATFSAFKDGLLFFDALKSGDYKLDMGSLAKFEESTASTLETARRLGAIASTIPAADMSALQTTTAALSAQAEALIRLAAVPFGDIGGAAANLSRQGGALLGGSGGSTTITNYFNLPQGSTQQTAQEVIRLLNTQMGARR